jgi:hypothetical protein
LKIGCVNRAFFSGREYADDTAKGGGFLEEWQKVNDEPSARIYNQGCGIVEAFWSLYMRTIVRRFILPL